MAADLRAAFRDHRGFSVRHLHYMRAVAAAWPTESEFLQTPAAELTWSHVTTLLTGFDDPSLRGSSWAAAAEGHLLQALLNETTAQVIAQDAAGDTDGRV